MVGLEQGKVRLESYSDQWPLLFAREAKTLRRALGGRLADLAHIGSTAVPGLCAKPIIDIAVAIRTWKDLAAVIDLLEGAGYAHKGEYGLRGRQFFIKGDPVTHHVHVVERGSPHWKRWLEFCDLLRRSDAARISYDKQKRRLAAKFEQNRDAYTAGKNPVIKELIKSAGAAS